jgi:hypothetical protein
MSEREREDEGVGEEDGGPRKKNNKAHMRRRRKSKNEIKASTLGESETDAE